MKRSIIITAAALMISAGISAQVSDQIQQQTTNDRLQIRDQDRDHLRLHDGSGSQNQENSNLLREERRILRDQERVQKMAQKKENHGRMVSELAKGTESGPGKGETVSSQAKARGMFQQARIKENYSAQSRSAFQGARGPGMHRNAGITPRGGGRK